MDKSFIDPLPSDRRAAIIASAIVDLAHTLSFTVVAEGVEKIDQMRFLDTIFCDQFQGYPVLQTGSRAGIPAHADRVASRSCRRTCELARSDAWKAYLGGASK